MIKVYEISNISPPNKMLNWSFLPLPSDNLQYIYDPTKPLLQQGTRTQPTGIGIDIDIDTETITQNYTYDTLARLTHETTTGRTVHYEYDNAFRLQSIYNQTQNSQQENLIAMLTYDYQGIDKINKWEITPYNQSTIEKQFEYDQFDYLSSTGDWEIENDEQGRIRYAQGHGVETHHDHDQFGNNILHEANPSPVPPSSTPPNTMVNWSFPPLPKNRIPTQTQDGAETWWQYRQNGEATWVGKSPGGDKINLDWDGLGLLKAVSDTSTNARHDFTYAPSGMRIRDKRTGTNQHDRHFVYTTTGALLSVHEPDNEQTSRTDIIYANGQAIAEIDQNNNIYELHNDYLGTPRYITNGNDGSQTEGQIIGEQAFGPYGEQMIGTFQTGQNTSITLPWGYRPVTGYTGHINEDLTGLIYMRGRYYSPLWHRFINSDQGVDPNSLNQFAYVGGSPFMATDPSGMAVLYTYNFTCDGSLVFSLQLAEELTDAERLAIALGACGTAGATVEINGGSSFADYFWWMFGPSFDDGGITPRADPGINPPNKNEKPQQSKTPEAEKKNCDDGFIGSVTDSVSSILGFFNPYNWNAEGMARLYELGPLGQAEAHGNAAYYATAGSLAVATAAVTGAGAVGAIEIGSMGFGHWLYQATNGSKMLTGNPYLRIGWGKGKDGHHWFRIASDKLSQKFRHSDLIKGPKTGTKCGKK